MATGYDGSIKIDTKIDEKGFNDGVKNMSKKVSIVGEAFKAMGRSVGGFFGNILKVVGTVISAIEGLSVAVLAIAAVTTLAILGVIAVMAGSIGALFRIDNYVKGLKDSLAQLKVSFATAFEPLVTAAIPYIQMVVNWLIKAFNTVQMIIAALMGQKTVQQAIANTTSSAAKGAGTLAKNTKDAKKAAEGALAAFDELNVLQMEKPDTETGGGGGDVGGNAGEVTFKTVPIEEGILATVEKIKKWFKDTWDKIVYEAMVAWTVIKIVWGIVAKWFQDNVITPVSAWFEQAWKDISKWASDAWEWIKQTWSNVSAWFQEKVITPVSDFFIRLWNRIGILANDAWVTIKFLWEFAVAWLKKYVIDPLSIWFYVTWNDISKWASTSWDEIKKVWDKVSAWFSENVTEPIRNIFNGALVWVEDKWKEIFTNIGNFVKGIINGIIDNLNSLISGFGTTINGITDGLNTVGRNIPGWIEIPTQAIPQIPRLATGAVIPANAPFAAILGDQRSGKNIEAPEGLIRQIIREEMSDNMSGDMNITMPVYLDSEKIYEGQQRVRQRRGTSLIDGAMA